MPLPDHPDVDGLRASLRAAHAESDSRLERLVQVRDLLALLPTPHEPGCDARQPRADDSECNCRARGLRALLP